DALPPAPPTGDNALPPAPPNGDDALPPAPPNGDDALPPAPPTGDDLPPPPPTGDDALAPHSARPPVVKWVKEKRGRHKKGEAKAAPGRQSWVWGTKLEFFSKRKAHWLKQAEDGQAGAFYTKMMKLYIKKYGYNLADDEDFEFDVADPPDEAANKVIHERLTAEEQDSRAKYTKNLRGRIGQWYRLQYGSLLKSDKTAFTEMFTGVLDGAPAKPTRGQLGHYYSRKFYDTRVKARADARIAVLNRRAELTGEEPPKKIDVISKVTKEVWEEETPEFQKECEVAMEREYAESLRAWEQSLADSPTRTPEEISATQENAGYYLQPFVNAIQERFGMCATVLLCGPVGKRGGRVMVQSVHAGKTKGLAPQTWPEYDWLGFQEVERAMINFGKNVFYITAEAECRARIVPGWNANGHGQQPGESVSGPHATALPPPAVRTGASTQGGSEQGPSRNAGAGGAMENDKDAVEPPAGEGVGSSQREDVEMEDGSGEKDGGEGAGEGGVGGRDKEGGERLGEGEKDNGYGPTVDEETRAEIEACWQRRDRSEWTEELGRVHAAFEQGKTLGIEWGECVDKFFDFEHAWGFEEGTFQMGKAKRPVEVGMWLQRGRKWYLLPTISNVGTRDDAKSFAGRWWSWYTSVQPQERVLLGNTLSRPEKADWSGVAVMHGTNGLLQMMAALSWWGEKLLKGRDGPEWPEWLAAVEDMTWMLEELLANGEIGVPKAGKKRKRRGAESTEANAEEDDTGMRRKKTKKAAETEDVPARRTRANPGPEEGRVLRGKARGKEKEQGKAAEKEKGRPKPRPVNFSRK
ncbi:hypothetical protein B0H16DRAFT_1479102, partial [Mycena metata]